MSFCQTKMVLQFFKFFIVGNIFLPKLLQYFRLDFLNKQTQQFFYFVHSFFILFCLFSQDFFVSLVLFIIFLDSALFRNGRLLSRVYFYLQGAWWFIVCWHTPKKSRQLVSFASLFAIANRKSKSSLKLSLSNLLYSLQFIILG